MLVAMAVAEMQLERILDQKEIFFFFWQQRQKIQQSLKSDRQNNAEINFFFLIFFYTTIFFKYRFSNMNVDLPNYLFLLYQLSLKQE